MEYIGFEILAIIVLVGLYALFSGLEIAIVGVRRSRVMRLYKKQIPGAKALYKFKQNPGKMTRITSYNVCYTKLLRIKIVT